MIKSHIPSIATLQKDAAANQLPSLNKSIIYASCQETQFIYVTDQNLFWMTNPLTYNYVLSIPKTTSPNHESLTAHVQGCIV